MNRVVSLVAAWQLFFKAKADIDYDSEYFCLWFLSLWGDFFHVLNLPVMYIAAWRVIGNPGICFLVVAGLVLFHFSCCVIPV